MTWKWRDLLCAIFSRHFARNILSWNIYEGPIINSISQKRKYSQTGLGSGSVKNMASIFKKFNIYWGQHPLIQKVCNECLVCAWHKEDEGLLFCNFYSVGKEVSNEEVNMYVRKTMGHVDEWLGVEGTYQMEIQGWSPSGAMLKLRPTRR